MKYLITVILVSVFAAAVHGGFQKPRVAVAAITTPKTSTITGFIKFTQNSCFKPVTVEVQLKGVPKGSHGFHIHQFGNLTDGCASAGLHWNPLNMTHGDLDGHPNHAGDFGNLIANAEGIVTTTFTSNGITLFGGNSIIGLTAVIHADIDDLGKGNAAATPITGNSGGRIGCGVVGKVLF